MRSISASSLAVSLSSMRGIDSMLSTGGGAGIVFGAGTEIFFIVPRPQNTTVGSSV